MILGTKCYLFVCLFVSVCVFLVLPDWLLSWLTACPTAIFRNLYVFGALFFLPSSRPIFHRWRFFPLIISQSGYSTIITTPHSLGRWLSFSASVVHSLTHARSIVHFSSPCLDVTSACQLVIQLKLHGMNISFQLAEFFFPFRPLKIIHIPCCTIYGQRVFSALPLFLYPNTLFYIIDNDGTQYIFIPIFSGLYLIHEKIFRGNDIEQQQRHTYKWQPFRYGSTFAPIKHRTVQYGQLA